MRNKTIKIKRYIILYFLVIMLTLWLFFPIDLITYKSTVSDHIQEYFFVNILLDSISIVFYFFGINYFNKKFWKNKIVIRFVLEFIYAILVINIILFIAQNIIAQKMSLYTFIVTNFQHISFFTTTLQGLFIMLIMETISLYDKKKNSELEQERFKYYLLKSQLNPHFLFNSLNILSAMCYTSKPKQTVSYISKLADVYRYILANNEKDIIPLSQELDFIYLYIDILRVRYSNNLILVVDIDNKNNEKNILFMSLELLVENAVKHNIISDDKPLTINISTKKDFVVIANNINQKDNQKESNRVGLGLINLNQRYNIIANKDIVVEKKDDLFTVKIPLI
jgi:two-component system LytT family sensor kinase